MSPFLKTVVTSIAVACSIVGVQGGDSTTDVYVPVTVDCPAGNLITPAGSPLNNTQVLHASEQAYLNERASNVTSALYTTYINDAATGTTGYDSTIFASDVPRVGLAVSGGGLRAALYGAGTFSAFDSANATNVGPLMQLADYMGGLSGGSWFITSLSLNDFPSPVSMVLGLDGQTGWLLDYGILTPVNAVLHPFEFDDYYDDVVAPVNEKSEAGYPVSLVDVWGVALGYHFFNQTTVDNFFKLNETAAHGAGYKFSDIRSTQSYQARAMPYPFIVTTSRVNESLQGEIGNGSDSTIIPLSNTQFTFTPHTFGSFDPSLSAYMPIEYAGTYLENGISPNSCTTNYETATFSIGTSAALFNSLEDYTSDTLSDIISTIADKLLDLKTYNTSVPLVANWPNSFKNYLPGTFESADNDILQLTDGGENGENVPISPLFVKARALDVVVAVDSSADSDLTRPNGTSLVTTAFRFSEWPANYTDFPSIPMNMSDFVAQGLDLRPTFFGCDAGGSTGLTSDAGASPILIYLPNAPPPRINKDQYTTNVSTFTLEYSYNDVVAFLAEAHDNARRGYIQDLVVNNNNGSVDNTFVDPDWPLCLKCAVLDRARQRNNVTRSDACNTCFGRYCWTEDSADALVTQTTNYNSILSGA